IVFFLFKINVFLKFTLQIAIEIAFNNSLIFLKSFCIEFTVKTDLFVFIILLQFINAQKSKNENREKARSCFSKANLIIYLYVTMINLGFCEGTSSSMFLISSTDSNERLSKSSISATVQ